MSGLVVRGLGVAVRGRMLVEGIDLTVAAGELVVLLGPNGAGKTSLLRGALGLVRAAAGTATIDGAEACTMTPAARARALAYLPQARPLAWPQAVRDVVALGRFAHGGALGRLSAADEAAVETALAECDLTAFADRSTATLSGGELARVHLARALAAQAPLIVADEPVAGLDPYHQHRVMAGLRAFVANGGGALAVLHDLDLAARYADRLVWMKAGRVVASGGVAETLTTERVSDVYNVRVVVAGGGVAVTGMA